MVLKNWDSLSAKTYCDVQAIDIILAEKYNIATANHIRTDFLVGGIKEANLDNVYLCSIFSNLLNNALEASKYCTTNPYIELKSRHTTRQFSYHLPQQYAASYS